MRKTIVLAGGSGFLGASLANKLREIGYAVVVLTRGANRTNEGVEFVSWDGATQGEWSRAVDGAEAVVNLTGKSVNCLYTPSNKREIYESRLRSVAAVAEAVRAAERPPRVVVQASSLAIYGDTRDVCAEDAPHGSGFAVDVCERWEDAFYRDPLPAGTRKVALRVGFALGRGGGALAPLVRLAKSGLGGTIGSGKQYISWIHIDDLNEMFVRAIQDDSIEGTYNATGPTPVTNKEFMKALREALGKRWAPPAPAPLVALGAVAFMRASPSLALTGRRCVPARFQREGFRFRYSKLEDALKDLL